MKGTTCIPAIAILLRKNGKVLVVLRTNTGWMDGYYSLPGGHVEPAESFRQAACREALEELGLHIQESQLAHRLTLDEYNAAGEMRIGVTFEVLDWPGEPYNAEPDVHGEIAWVDPDKLPENVTPHTLLTLEQIASGNVYTEMGWKA